MRTHQAVLVAIVAAFTLTSVVAASPQAAKQRVAISSKGLFNATGRGAFVFEPLQAGPLEPDSGTQTSVWTSRTLMRQGQGVEIEVTLETLEGKRGSLVLRGRAEYVDAGYGYVVGPSTWKVIRGTGQYAGVTGGGRGGGLSFLPKRRWQGRYEGFLAVP